MADHAGHLVEVVRRIGGIELDYSIESLDAVERLLDRFHDAGDDPQRMAETMFQFGAYIGEVMVHHAGGRWLTVPPEHPLGGAWPLMELPNQDLANPIGKTFKRVRNGAGDSIVYFYQVMLGS
jgi:hypothetical protein